MGERPCDWIAVDWGTSRLRVWAMAGASMLAAADSASGMAALSPDGFEPALLELIGPWLGQGPGRAPMPVVICGMAGARQGWAEVPYRAVPCVPLADGGMPVATRDPRLSVTILPGLKQAAPADVMRGEETQIAGFLAAEPGFDGVLCLPGTHSKWVRVSAGEVVGFRTFMTGELFGLLATASVLRHSVGEGWDEAAFAEALGDALSRPADLAARLFGLRAEALLNGLAPGAARARLSGLLIGMELAGTRPWWLGQRVVILGAEGLAGPYAAALRSQGLDPACADADTATRAGLARALVLRGAAR